MAYGQLYIRSWDHYNRLLQHARHVHFLFIIIIIIIVIIIITIIIIIELTHSKTILEITFEIEPQPVALDFKSFSQYSNRSK